MRAGETISGIAARYGITQKQLIDANGLTGGRIYVGQQLRLVPPAAAVPAAAADRAATRSGHGDTLSSIAQRYGTTVRAIQDANGIRDANLVRSARTLKLPGTGGGGSIACPVQGAPRS